MKRQKAHVLIPSLPLCSVRLFPSPPSSSISSFKPGLLNVVTIDSLDQIVLCGAR